ncbi:suppressor of tumorigenicity 14 -like protein [Brachionus plicatilis]|uniref:Suppressor of tumorigenicity 14-like protein n=1 Tax=Brachionus plicatilis TaxID=10195 RepID=A0A3M7R2Z0_BRAPC|nr:suppressor of tumorigenicity 14 -like protein [Brachionus plicatilis]
MKINSEISATKPSPHKCFPKSKPLQALCISSIILGFLILIIGIILIALFGTIPCSLIICHSKASKCINHPFRAECICDFGYQGDGLHYCDECGLSFAEKNLKIIGGIDAASNSWPSAAYLRFFYEGDVAIQLEDGSTASVYVKQGGLCGGSLIDRKHVLTAAHCLQAMLKVTYNNKEYYSKAKINSKFPSLESMYLIFLGINDISALTSSQAYSIKKIYNHEEYSGSTLLNDIAVIKLDDEVVLNSNIQLACVPDFSKKYYPTGVNIKSWVIGWGFTNQSAKTLPNLLQNLNVYIYDPSVCSDVGSEVEKNWNSQICAGDIVEGKSACNGDSGGSLFVLDSVQGKNKFMSVGIVSYGNGTCGGVDNPQIYTRISYFGEWIQSKKFS